MDNNTLMRFVSRILLPTCKPRCWEFIISVLATRNYRPMFRMNIRHENGRATASIGRLPIWASMSLNSSLGLLPT